MTAMSFKIRLGVPQMLSLWQRLSEAAKNKTISKDDETIYKKWAQAMVHIARNPKYPGLHSHEIPELSKRYGTKVYQSYLENHTSRAMRMYWIYGPNKQEITIIGLEPHPEDKKNTGYDKVVLSSLPTE